MRLVEIESEETRRDVAGAMTRAGADVEVCEKVLAAANEVLRSAEVERDRCARLIGSLQQRLAANLEQMRQAKRRALESAANQTPDRQSYDSFVKLRQERAWLTDVLSFVGTWTAEDAARAHILAEIREREATAALFEAQAARARLNLLAVASSAFEADPGAAIDVKESWSQRAAAEAIRIRSVVIPDLEAQLKRSDARAAEQRELVGAALWS